MIRILFLQQQMVDLKLKHLRSLVLLFFAHPLKSVAIGVFIHTCTSVFFTVASVGSVGSAKSAGLLAVSFEGIFEVIFLAELGNSRASHGSINAGILNI